jgi:hypothetical protein
LAAASSKIAGSSVNRQSTYWVIDVSACGTDGVPETIIAS